MLFDFGIGGCPHRLCKSLSSLVEGFRTMVKRNQSPAAPIRPFARWLIPASAGIAIAAMLSGFLLDPRPFLVNLLAGIFGIFTGAAVTLLIVERYLLYQRKVRWARVEEYTVRAIAVHLSEIAGGLFLHFPSIKWDAAEAIFSGHNRPPNSDTLQAMGKLLIQLNEVPSSISKDKSSSDAAVEYYEDLKWDLDQIQSVLTPRLLQGPTDQHFIDDLVAFDSARRELHHSIIGHQQAVTHAVFGRLVPMIGLARQLYASILKRWEETRPQAP
jgi:hypothetical protein